MRSIIITQLAKAYGSGIHAWTYSMQTAGIFLILSIIPAIFLIRWLKQQKAELIVDSAEKEVTET